MANINASDILYATVLRRGTTLLSLRLSGLSSFSELMLKLRSAIHGESGLVTLMLRNGTQGWSRSQNLLLTAA